MNQDLDLVHENNPGHVYTRLWQRYVAQMQAMRAQLTALGTEEEISLGIDEEYLRVFRSDEHYYERKLASAAGKILSRLVQLASDAFAPRGGASLEIDDREYRERHVIRRAVERFDPSTVWAELEAEFGGERGHAVAYQQAAAELVDFFSIVESQEIKTVGSRVVLGHTIYIDGMDKKYSRQNRLSYNSQEDLRKGLFALKTFGQWAGFDELAIMAERFAHHWCMAHKRDVQTRERHDLGEDLQVITYTSRFEYRFSQVAAAKLQEFVSTYAGDRLKSRSAA